MTNDEKYLRTRMGKQPFSIPEGYFDQLVPEVMARIDKEPLHTMPAQKKAVIMWLRPILYVAACLFIGIVSFNIYFDDTNHQQDVGMQLAVQMQTTADDEYVDELADYAMMDNYDIYAYLTND